MRSLGFVTALALVACSQPAPGAPAAPPPQAATAPVQTAATNLCPATASTPWSAGAATFTITAAAAGPFCANSAVTITIADAARTVVHTQTYVASSMTPLADATSVDDMSRMLREWITPAGASKDSTGDLAPWAADAPTPIDAEVPFTPTPGIGRAEYTALRAADAPMYCYQESNEAGLCFAMRGGKLSLIGTQTYAS
ncbi:MAG: hypothetical protein QM759_15410 [Terricaulis sp.]